VSRSIELVGITTAQFGNSQQTTFKTTIADNAGTVCGTTSSTRACTASDVSLTFSRRDVRVSYTLTVASTASATAGSTLDAYTGSSQFATDLTSAGVSVTSTATTSTAAAASSTSSDTYIIIAVVAAVLVLAVGMLIFCMRSRPGKMELTDVASKLGPPSQAV